MDAANSIISAANLTGDLLRHRIEGIAPKSDKRGQNAAHKFSLL